MKISSRYIPRRSVQWFMVVMFALASADGAERTRSGLQVLYDFSSASGPVVKDRSGVGDPVDLRIEDMNSVRRSAGTLEVRGSTLIRSDQPATKIIDAVKRSGEISIEAWIRPARNNQTGPARILTLSKDANARDFTLGHEGDRYDVRLRTTDTSGNGTPSVATESKSVKPELTHVVYTRDRSGRTRVYLNGERATEKNVSGATSNWDGSFRLALANELSKDRSWLGTYHLVAIYSRDLTPGEVEQNFQAGLGSAEASVPTAKRAESGLQALYDFSSASGPVVQDRSGVGEPVDLRIEDMKSVRRSEGALEVVGPTLIRSDKPAFKIIHAVRSSGAITIEAWVRPARDNQTGPARLVTLSKDSGARNFTLGQDGDHYEVRLRTAETTLNGAPSVVTAAKSLDPELTHVVYTRDRSGRARIYLNGKRTVDQKVSGATSNWDDSFRLALANELSNDRPWLGTYRLVAIFSRDLSPTEIEQHFLIGADRTIASALPTQRTQSGLQALYDFSSATGPVVEDRSGVGEPVDLKIEDMKAVRRSEGALEVVGPTLIRSDKPAARMAESVRRSGEISIEAWVRPARDNQTGPARIFTLSKDSVARNFTLGQDGDRFDVRLRTTDTGLNGVPSVGTQPKTLKPELTHVVYTRDRSGRARIYLNGQQTVEKKVSGATSNWDGSFRLALANELSKDRPWLGTYYLVAIYNRDLTPTEVEQNYRAGHRADPEALLAKGADPQLFHTKIAPLLAKHCLECHDSVTKKGKLDLSQKHAALAGSRDGVVLVPGDAEKSVLWKMVESDEMPEDRSPLSSQEKKLLRQWIDTGAVWAADVIDPSVYALDTRATAIWVRRLTRSEYIQTVRTTLGVDIAEEAFAILPEDLRADGFNNTAYNLTVDLGHVEAYVRLAEMIVDRMDVKAFAARFTKRQKLTDNDMDDLIAKMGKWLLRGPLESYEIDLFRGVSTTVASAGGDFKEAVGFILEAMLQSPRFMYRVENQRGDGTAWPVGEYELASRMSYILWGGPPDEELMGVAEAGFDPQRVEAQVQRMLEDPRAVERSAQFLYEWLALDRLDNMQPNTHHFPNWKPQLAADMRNETLAFFKDVVWKQKRPLADLLNAQLTYATPELAQHYGLRPTGPGLQRYDVSTTPARGGLLTQGSTLTVGGDEASMVSRGLFVLKDLLRGTVKDPPPCVDTTPVASRPGLTQRGAAEARIANPNCGGCHSKFEPLAFGLEKFTGVGGFQESDRHGNPLRDDGEILFPGAAQPIPYQSSAELMDLLAASDRVKKCISWKLTQFALGRPLGAADVPILDKIHQAAQSKGGTYASLMTAIVTSDLVQRIRTEPQQ